MTRVLGAVAAKAAVLAPWPMQIRAIASSSVP
jgi:hypothetical protein